MSTLLSWIFPREFFERPQYFRAFGLGMVYLLLLLAQLFTYEKFADITFGFGIIGGEVTSRSLAVLLPLAALFALPYLMSMRVSAGIRSISRFSVALMPILWLFVGLWINLSPSASHENTGLLGATFVTLVGWWVVVVAALLLWAAIAVIRGLPLRSK